MLAAAAGAALGAPAAYLLDPDRRWRRTAADTATHATRQGVDFAGKARRDLRNRAAGTAAATRARLSLTAPRGRRLERLVAVKVERACQQPHGIQVAAHDDAVTLTGPVLRDDAERVRRVLARTRGIGYLEDRLEIKERPEDLPAARGEGTTAATLDAFAAKPELLQQRWSPSTRLLAGTAGGGLVAYGLKRRGLAGALAGASGALLLSRAASNLRLGRVTGVGAGRDAVELHKSIQVDAPVERVWALWDGYERFPSFMRHVREVRVHDSRSHWKVEGPFGATVQWDAETTRREPPHRLAWRTLPGAAVQHAGMVELEPSGSGTRVRVALSYNPVAGAAGHAVASLLGGNPAKQLDDDLLRLKMLAETGKQPRDAARPEQPAPEPGGSA